MLFEWSEHFSWEIIGTRLTAYIGTYKGCLSDQDILPEKSEALDSPAILEHTKIVWMIRTSLLRNQRHWTHILCWNMQRMFEWWNSSWEIKGTGLTFYSRTCKDCLSDQNIPPDKSEALDSQPMLEHAKIVWVIRTFLLKKSEALDLQPTLKHAKIVWVIRIFFLRNQRHWTYPLCWNM